MAEWTEEKKKKFVDMYLEMEPTPQNSVELVKEIADSTGESPNAVRAILMKAEVYVKKDAPKAGAAATGDKPARVGKEAAHATLTLAIEAAGHTVDSEIISKLTGKAAVYFTSLFSK